MSYIGALRAGAAELDEQAATVEPLLDLVAEVGGSGSWAGPAADRFADDLERHRRWLHGIARELRAHADRLRAQADHLEAEVERARRAAEAERVRVERRREPAPRRDPSGALP